MQKQSSLRNQYIWNTVGSTLTSLCSILFLFFATRILFAHEAGIYATAFAVAQQIFVVAVFEMRTKQGVDVSYQYSDRVYLLFKCASCTLALVVTAVWLWIRQDSPDVWPVMLSLCGYYTALGFLDYLHGTYQQHGRLDIAGRSLTGLNLCLIAGFALTLKWTRSLSVACFTAFAIVLIWMSVYDAPRFRRLVRIEAQRTDGERLLSLFRICLPLFLSMFLTMYLTNAPKYALNAYCTYEQQAVFGYISTPAFLVNLFGLYTFRPQLAILSAEWIEKRTDDFTKRAQKLTFAMAGLGLALTIGMALIGVPVLSFFYGVDLAPSWQALIICILGGSFNALCTLFYNLIVIQGGQAAILPVFALAAAYAAAASNLFTRAMGLNGAAIAYATTYVVVAICLGAIAWRTLIRARRGAGFPVRQKEGNA